MGGTRALSLAGDIAPKEGDEGSGQFGRMQDEGMKRYFMTASKSNHSDRGDRQEFWLQIRPSENHLHWHAVTGHRLNLVIGSLPLRRRFKGQICF